MRGKRPRNRETEKYVAQRQGLYLGMDPEEALKLIDKKGGDYYKFDLYPDQGVIKNAEADFNSFRTGTPAMMQVADDMRSYYGMGSALPSSSPKSAPAPAVMATPAPVEGAMQGPAEAFKDKKLREVKEQMNIVDERPMVEQVTDDLVEQQQVASAEQMRQQHVDDISNGVQERIDQALEDIKPKGFILEDPIADIALLTGASLAAGGGIGAAVSKDDDEDFIKKAKELGLIT